LHFFPLPFSFSGFLAFLFSTEFMLFDFVADFKKTTAVLAPAHLFFHMHLPFVGDTLSYDRWRRMFFLAETPDSKSVMEET
jgi:hypothetical protein